LGASIDIAEARKGHHGCHLGAETPDHVKREFGGRDAS
jgi:hypothetical protein